MNIADITFQPFILTIKLSIVVTIILFLMGIPISYYLSYTKSRMKPIFEAAVALPLVLPPSVLGFYLLLVMGKYGILGRFWNSLFGHQLAFHFEGLVIASVLFSLPFMINPLSAGFRSIRKDLIEASYTLGRSKFYTLINVILPNMKHSILTGIVLTFAHTIGEFGVVLMIGGSIDNETKVVSIAIYEAVERLDYPTAHIYAGILFFITFITLTTVYLLNKKFEVN